jgi:hypothetical protein
MRVGPAKVSRHFLFLGSLLPLLLSLTAFAGTSATVTFTLDFPGSEPDHYVISADANGRGTYDSTGKLSADVEDAEPFHLDFSLTPSTQERIFDLAKRAHYFDGKIDSGKKNIASTGVKTLAYKDSDRSSQATYNYSPNPAVQQLTALFQNLSTTLEFGRRLVYFHRFQKLALDQELKRMEEMAGENSLEGLSAIAPILQKIAADNSVINVDRARAQRLLALGSAGR